MSSASVYNRIFGVVLKLSILMILIFGVTLFLLTAKKKEDIYAYTLMENVRNVKVESTLFDAIGSLLTREKVEQWERITRDDLIKMNPAAKKWDLEGYAIASFSPKSVPLTEEMYLTVEDSEIEVVRSGAPEGREIFGSYFLIQSGPTLAIQGADMGVSSSVKSAERHGFKGLSSKGAMHKTVHLNKGLHRFVVCARNDSTKPDDPMLDTNCKMEFAIDDNTLGSALVRKYDPNKLQDYHFWGTVEEGWHNLIIMFANASTAEDLKQRLRRKLMIFKINQDLFLQKIVLFVKEEFAEYYLSSAGTFHYFRSHPIQEKNALITFFIEKFTIDRLREMAAQKRYTVDSLKKYVRIGGLEKYAVFAPAPTKIRVTFPVQSKNVHIVFGFGVLEEAWDKPGDGVEFRVVEDVGPDAPAVILFSRYINPKENKSDRRWFQGDVDLSRYAGEEVTLIFETVGSPGAPFKPIIDTAYDYAVWTS
ncbi:MAG: hypothetical protein ABIJ27_00135 [Candidatus Omnitrophota bacterium]